MFTITNCCVFYMIFRNNSGELVEINKYNYSNDTIYYEKVMKLQEEFTKCIKEEKNMNKSSNKNSIIKELFSDDIKKPFSGMQQISKICKFINIEH